MLQNLLQSLKSLTPLSEGIISYPKDHLQPIYLCKKQILLKEGNVCWNIYFVSGGFLRAFYLKDEKEVTSWFMGEGEVIISVYSFFTQSPGTENIQALQDSTLLSLTYEQLQYI